MSVQLYFKKLDTLWNLGFEGTTSSKFFLVDTLKHDLPWSHVSRIILHKSSYRCRAPDRSCVVAEAQESSVIFRIAYLKTPKVLSSVIACYCATYVDTTNIQRFNFNTEPAFIFIDTTCNHPSTCSSDSMLRDSCPGHSILNTRVCHQ